MLQPNFSFFFLQIFANIIHNKNDSEENVLQNKHHEISPAIWKNTKTSLVPSGNSIFQKIAYTLTHWKNTISFYAYNVWNSYKVRPILILTKLHIFSYSFSPKFILMILPCLLLTFLGCLSCYF